MVQFWVVKGFSHAVLPEGIYPYPSITDVVIELEATSANEKNWLSKFNLVHLVKNGSRLLVIARMFSFCDIPVESHHGSKGRWLWKTGRQLVELNEWPIVRFASSIFITCHLKYLGKFPYRA